MDRSDPLLQHESELSVSHLFIRIQFFYKHFPENLNKYMVRLVDNRHRYMVKKADRLWDTVGQMADYQIEP